MLHVITSRKLRILCRRFYEKGISKGYELGWQMRGIEQGNRGFIIGNQIDRDLEEIMKHSIGGQRNEI